MRGHFRGPRPGAFVLVLEAPRSHELGRDGALVDGEAELLDFDGLEMDVGGLGGGLEEVVDYGTDGWAETDGAVGGDDDADGFG